MSEKILVIKGREFVDEYGCIESEISYRCDLDSQLNSRKGCVLRFWGRDQQEVYEKLKFDYEIVQSNGIYNIWFDSIKLANVANQKILDLENKLNFWVVTDINENNHVKYKTLFECDMMLPNGEVHTYVDNFGYGYPIDYVVYIWLEGNYACDCNRILSLQRNGIDVDESECSNNILLEEFRVYLEMLN